MYAEESFDYCAFENKMKLYVTETYEACSRIVHNENIQDFLELLAFGWNESEQSALNISKKLNLRKIHILAVQDELDLFIEEWFQERNDEIVRNYD